MMESPLFERMKEILCSELDVDPALLTLDASLVDDLGADSLDLVHLALEVEESFQVEVDQRDLMQMKTVRDVFEYLHTRIPASA